MKELFTINYEHEYVFKNWTDAVDTISDLRQRFPDEIFIIDTIYEDDPEFTEYEQYAD